MKWLKLVFMLVFMPAALLAWERTMIHLTSPSGLDKLQLRVSVHHRLRGPVDQEPFDTFFGLKSGANVGTSFRFTMPTEAIFETVMSGPMTCVTTESADGVSG